MKADNSSERHFYNFETDIESSFFKQGQGWRIPSSLKVRGKGELVPLVGDKNRTLVPTPKGERGSLRPLANS